MQNVKTLLELSGADTSLPALKDVVLVLIDMQNEYLSGPLALPDVQAAVTSAQNLLRLTRLAGAPVVHVAHKGRAGGLFDRDHDRGAFIPRLCPTGAELTVEKGLPNAFCGTGLAEILAELKSDTLVLAGFMTHMCVSSTARAALDNGYRIAIDATACATRDLPDGRDGVIDASTLNTIALVELSDRFATINWSGDWSAR
ncbi:MAG: cysteine hydrolase [Rhodobacteraceae bacterium]|nr:cysteine hydrolase [Paracoccaceae bacterium]